MTDVPWHCQCTECGTVLCVHHVPRPQEVEVLPGLTFGIAYEIRCPNCGSVGIIDSDFTASRPLTKDQLKAHTN